MSFVSKTSPIARGDRDLALIKVSANREHRPPLMQLAGCLARGGRCCAAVDRD
jgi:hypothetical protein